MGKVVKLYCQLGDHEWSRPSQRGAHPRNCPEHKAEAAEQAALVVSEPVQRVPDELVRAGVEATLLPYKTVLAFLDAGLRLRHRDSIDESGYGMLETKALDKYYNSSQPEWEPKI